MKKRKKRKKQVKLPVPLQIQPEELEALQLRSKLSVSDWAKTYRKLSRKTTRLHGDWSHELTPFILAS